MIEAEVVIIGAGPAGLCAAIEAAKQGLEVLLFDEHSRAGGQLFKQIHKFFGSQDHKAGRRGFEIARELIEEAENLRIELCLESRALGLFEAKVIGIEKNRQLQAVKAEAIILATGASENSIAFPGWTLPGVMGAGAVQTMVNLYRVLPGKRVLMVGSGNVGLIVSYQLLQAGADVVAIIEAEREIGGYGVHSAKIRRAGVPILTLHTVMQANGRNGVESAIIGQVDEKGRAISGSEQVLNVDLICLAVGLSPLAELAWMAGCRCLFSSELGGYVPVHDRDMRTTERGIYVAGDISGVEEASTAMEEGKLAGISVAQGLGYIENLEADRIKKKINQRLRYLRQGPFGKNRYKAKKEVVAAVAREA